MSSDPLDVPQGVTLKVRHPDLRVAPGNFKARPFGIPWLVIDLLGAIPVARDLVRALVKPSFAPVGSPGPGMTWEALFTMLW